MINVLTLDNTENSIYKELVDNHVGEKYNTTTGSFDTAYSLLGTKKFDVVVMSRVRGRADTLDVLDQIKYSKLNKKTVVVIIEDNRSSATRFKNALRGRKVYVLPSTKLGAVKDILSKVV